MTEIYPVLSMGVPSLTETLQGSTMPDIEGDTKKFQLDLLQFVALSNKTGYFNICPKRGETPHTTFYFRSGEIVGVTSSDPEFRYLQGRYETLYHLDGLLKDVGRKSDNEVKERLEKVAEQTKEDVIRVISYSVKNKDYCELWIGKHSMDSIAPLKIPGIIVEVVNRLENIVK